MHKPQTVLIIAAGLLVVLSVFCPASFAENQDQALLEAAKQGDLKYLEIEVSHTRFSLEFYEKSSLGKKKLLYQCRVGLGSPEFPTPLGVFYICRIYEDNPWWVPSPNQKWATGKRPSRKVYGGTMAPLLKKISVRVNEQMFDSEDVIGERITLDDFGYSLCGTDEPWSVGRCQTHGDIVMLPKHAAKIAELIKEQVGVAERKESETGRYVLLRSPVRLNLVK